MRRNGKSESEEQNADELLQLRDAALKLGISFPTIKQWIYRRKIRSVQTAGGHHCIPQSEVDKLLRQELLTVGAPVDRPRVKDMPPLDDTAFTERSPRRRRDRASYRLQSGRCDLDAVLDRERSRRHGAV